MNFTMNLKATAEVTFREVLADMKAKGHVVAVQEIEGNRIASILITEPVQLVVTIDGLGDKRPLAVQICDEFTKTALKAIGPDRVEEMRANCANPMMLGAAAYEAMDNAFTTIVGREYTPADNAVWLEAWAEFRKGGA